MANRKMVANKTTNRAQQLWAAVFEGIKPIPSLKVTEWANKHRFLSPESSSEPGKFVPFPYQLEPLDAILDAKTSEVILWWASQTSKSETLNTIVGYYMHADPSPILLVQPTIELAEAWSLERIAPMIRDSPALRRIVRAAKSRDGGNRTLFKQFPGGNLAMVGANAPSGLAGRPRRVVIQDEIDRFPASAGTEGDPCALADMRTTSFPNAVKVKASTGTIKGRSKIEKAYEQTDQRKWHVTCKCAHEFVFMWEHVHWEDGKEEDAWMACPKCVAKINDKERVAMVRAGRWKATAPFKGIRGYWLNGINTLFRAQKGFRSRIHQFVADFLKAKDTGREAMKVWINTFLAETYEEESEKIDPIQILGRLEDYSPQELPEEVCILTGAADVHKMFIQLDVAGWWKDEEMWGVQHRQFDGDTERDEVWAKLDAALIEQCTRVDGVKLGLSRVFIDMGYRDKRVLAFCAPRIGRGVYPCKGIRREGINIPPLLPARPNRNNKARIPHWPVGVTMAKSAIYDRITLAPPGPRTMHFPKEQGYDEEYFKQVTSEVRKIKYQFGKPYSIFEKPNNAVKNEALDLNVYNLAALHSMPPIAWQQLAKNLKDHAPRAPRREAGESVMTPDGKIEKTMVAPTPSPDPQPVGSAPNQPRAQDPHNPSAPMLPAQPAPLALRPFRQRGGFVQRWR